MKYFIDSKRPIDERIDIEREMPARLKVADLIRRNYNCDTFYFYADRVGMIFIVDLDEAEQVSEIILLLRRVGLTPEIFPLVPSDDMDRIVVELAEKV